MQMLDDKIAEDWPKPKLTDLDNTALLQRMVAKSIFCIMFGVWLSDGEATTLAGWRTNAQLFVLLRLVQRVLFNAGIRRVQALRVATVNLVEKYQLEGVFEKMNNDLPKPYRRQPVVKLCDEIMYIIGFAGVGGTCAAVESVAAFLQAKKPSESAKDAIDFSKYQTPEAMVAAFRRDPTSYIKETCRLDPPVTSATQLLKQSATVELAGRQIEVPAGTMNQYVIAMANRDDSVFVQSQVFDPERANLGKALTWHGAFGADAAADEAAYPRICPGRYLSLDITRKIFEHALSGTLPSSPPA
eukprot:TRINITY_DN16245_c0_g1_i1.p1 TRINITY_DN16245_c0_g1~~TRINITY_DN16245_c0_g1_i1.p1  ORF type:complete len:300 (-),score=46.20 TRINITY_DN16245_c0_g1_i1:577-1476(-)